MRRHPGGPTRARDGGDAGYARSAELERAADRVALDHTLPRARAAGWFAESGGLSVDNAKRSVGDRLGVDLRDVTVQSGMPAGAPPGALASTMARVINVSPAGFSAATPVGQALLAHELTHVVQQSSDSSLPVGLSSSHQDRVRSVGRAPPGMAQHSIGCSGSCDSPAPPAATTFADVQRTFAATRDPATRSSVLTKGIATARANATRLYRGSARPPVSTLREQYEREASIDISYDNPFIGVSQDHVEQAYRAWAENPAASEPPWVLLAVWVKEGLTETSVATANAAGIPATSAADARAIYRSMAYFVNMGADVYIHHTVTGADNRADFAAGTGSAHDTAFRAQIDRQVKAGRLPRDLSADMDATLTVAAAGPGTYRVTATPRFYELSLLLVDAFYREQREALVKDPRVGKDPDPGLVYMSWNMKASSFNDFLNRPPNPDLGGSVPSRETGIAAHRLVAATSR